MTIVPGRYSLFLELAFAIFRDSLQHIERNYFFQTIYEACLHLQNCNVDTDMSLIRKPVWDSGATRLLQCPQRRTAGRRGRQKACAWQTGQGYNLSVISWSSLTLMFSGLLHKDLFKRKWSLAKSYFKQKYRHACHTKFAVFFPLPSCCVSSLTLALGRNQRHSCKNTHDLLVGTLSIGMPSIYRETCPSTDVCCCNNVLNLTRDLWRLCFLKLQHAMVFKLGLVTEWKKHFLKN